jgi:hypothetical protein
VHQTDRLFLEVIDFMKVVQDGTGENSGSNREDFRLLVSVVVQTVALEKSHVLRSQIPVEILLIFQEFPIAGSLMRPSEDVRHLDFSFIVYEHIFWFDVTQFEVTPPNFCQSSSEGEERIPELKFLERFSFALMLLDELRKKIREVRILVLCKKIITVSCPVLPQRPPSLLYSTLVGRYRKAGSRQSAFLKESCQCLYSSSWVLKTTSKYLRSLSSISLADLTPGCEIFMVFSLMCLLVLPISN